MDVFQGIKGPLDKILRFLEEAWGRVDLKSVLREVGELLVQVFGFFADIIRWLIDKI